MAAHLLSLSLFIVFTIAAIHGSADRVLEDGYTVRTVLDGNKLGINPHSILPRYGSSDFIILDSSNSVFYTVSSPLSQESQIKRLSGGTAGDSDGDSASAMFSKPRSLAVDLKGNVYVADQSNGVIRKITNRGVTTTIAGGYAQKTGKVDGPAQNASFSKDYELVFVPEKCALLVSDHGNQLVREIDLRVEDCRRSSQSVLGGPLWFLIGLGVSCLVGFIVGIILRPYVIPHEGFCTLLFSETWKHCLIHLGKQVLMLCFDIRSVIASSMLYALLRRLISLSLSHLSLMFRINIVESQFSWKESVSLLDSDDLCISEPTKPQMSEDQWKDLTSFDRSLQLPDTSSKIFMQTKSHMFADQLKDLLTFDGSSELSNATEKIFKEGDDNQGKRDISPESCGRIERMIEANFMGFVEQAKVSTPVELCSSSNTGLVKRR